MKWLFIPWVYMYEAIVDFFRNRKGGSMKTLVIVVSVVFSMANISMAWEFQNNPDRVPSLGLHATTSRIDGSRAEIDSPGGSIDRIYKGQEIRRKDVFGGDLRLPVHDSLTLSLSYDAISINDEFVRSGNVFKQTSTLNGYEAGVGVRVYLDR